MWDANCEAKAWELMTDYADDVGKPSITEQQEVANWLNQMLPYPGWSFSAIGSLSPEPRLYWVASHDQMGRVYFNSEYGYRNVVKGKTTSTLIELITQLELGL